MYRPGFQDDGGPGSGKTDILIIDTANVYGHSRLTHTFELPDRAIDKALATGDISVTLPYVKKESVELLKASYATSEEAN